MEKSFLISSIALFSFTTTFGQNVKNNEVPSAVRSALHEKYPDAKDGCKIKANAKSKKSVCIDLRDLWQEVLS
jgi:hypothetical protein